MFKIASPLQDWTVQFACADGKRFKAYFVLNDLNDCSQSQHTKMLYFNVTKKWTNVLTVL